MGAVSTKRRLKENPSTKPPTTNPSKNPPIGNSAVGNGYSVVFRCDVCTNSITTERQICWTCDEDLDDGVCFDLCLNCAKTHPHPLRKANHGMSTFECKSQLVVSLWEAGVNFSMALQGIQLDQPTEIHTKFFQIWDKFAERKCLGVRKTNNGMRSYEWISYSDLEVKVFRLVERILIFARLSQLQLFFKPTMPKTLL